MAYALVGSIGTVANGNPTCSPTFAQATTAGHLLVAFVTSFVTESVSTDSGWVKAVVNALTPFSAIWYKANCAAGETAPTFTGGNGFANLAEFSGGATSSPKDQSGAVRGTTSPQVAVCGAADAALGELVITVSSWADSKAGTVTTADSYNNGATPTGNINNDSTSTTGHYRHAYGITTSKAAADQDSASDNSMNLSNCSAAIASFLLATTARTPRNPAINLNDPAFV